LAAKAKIAADMEAADIKKEAAEAAKLRAKLEKNAGIDDLISSFDEVKEPKPTPTTGTSKGLPSKATAQRDGICSRCNTPIKKGTACLWIKGEGIIHNHCGTP
jgi:membrane protein involved in colicin uptake